MDLSLPWHGARRLRRGAARAVDDHRARQRPAGDGRGRGARGEGGLVSAFCARCMREGRRDETAHAFSRRRSSRIARHRAGRAPTTRASLPGRALRLSARSRQPSGISHRVVVRHRVGRPTPPATRTASRSRSFAIARGVAEANPSAFAPRQLVFAHAALADPRRGRLLHDQRAARDGLRPRRRRRGVDASVDRRLVACARRRRVRRAHRRARVRVRPRASRRRSRCCCRATPDTRARGRRRRRRATTTASRSSL